MNANYNHFEAGGSNDEKFDPTFTRHHGDEGNTDFSHVNEVNVVSRQQGSSGAGEQHQDELRHAAAAAARMGEVQQQVHVQVQQHQLQQQVLHNYQLHQATNPDDDKPLDDSESRPFHRPISTTKRAAQNRNAQRAFRQRKEKYIKELEAKAAETDHLKQTIEELRAENLQLRDYTLALQSRVIELSPSTSQPMANVNVNPGTDSSTIVPPPPAAIFSNQTSTKVFQSEK